MCVSVRVIGARGAIVAAAGCSPGRKRTGQWTLHALDPSPGLNGASVSDLAFFAVLVLLTWSPSLFRSNVSPLLSSSCFPASCFCRCRRVLGSRLCPGRWTAPCRASPPPPVTETSPCTCARPSSEHPHASVAPPPCAMLHISLRRLAVSFAFAEICASLPFVCFSGVQCSYVCLVLLQG